MGNNTNQVFQLISGGNEEQALEALKNCKNVNLISDSGLSVLRASIEKGMAKLFKYCFTRNAVLTPPLSKGRTVLHFSTELGHYEFTWKLLREIKTFGLNIDDQDTDGRTSLHLAVESCNSDLVALFFKYNAKKDLRDSLGQTPYDLAVSIKNPKIESILEQFNIQDYFKKSVTDYKASPKDQVSTQVSKDNRQDPEKSAKISMLKKALEETHVPIIKSDDLVIQEIINKGSSCLVYKGKWDNNDVAVKQFTTEYSESEKKMKKFAKELRVLTNVNHPNLLLLMGICIDRPNLCLVTELVPNFTLFYAIHKNKEHKLTLEQRFSIAIQLCRGIAYLHNNSPPIIHRDLKPENCLMDHNLNLKIADFGLARFSSSFIQGEESMTTICIGTTRFMAPELFENSQSEVIGIEVDIWALGCMLIEIFSSKRPWHYISSSKANSIFFEIFNKKPIPVPENIDFRVAGIIGECCQYNPKLRPSAQSVLERIEAVKNA